MPTENECDYRYVIIAHTYCGAKVHCDDEQMKYLQTGDVISKTYVPDWWVGSYTDYVAFVGCLQTLYGVSKIKAIRLVKAISNLSLRESKDYADDMCAPMGGTYTVLP